GSHVCPGPWGAHPFAIQSGRQTSCAWGYLNLDHFGCLARWLAAIRLVLDPRWREYQQNLPDQIMVDSPGYSDRKSTRLNSSLVPYTTLFRSAAAMFALGLGVHIRSLFKVGAKPVVLGVISTSIILVVSLGGSLLFG